MNVRLFIYSGIPAKTSISDCITGYLCRGALTALAHCFVVVFVTIYFIVICYFALNCCGISLLVVASPLLPLLFLPSPVMHTN